MSLALKCTYYFEYPFLYMDLYFKSLQEIYFVIYQVLIKISHSTFVCLSYISSFDHADPPPPKYLDKAYRPNAHLLYIVMHYNGNII